MKLLVTTPMNSIRRRRAVIGSIAIGVVSAQCFFNWGKNRTIYPPSTVSTKNRLFPTYLTNSSELHDLLLFKEPLLLNFTYQGDPKCNKLTQALFDLLADEKRYPVDSHQYSVNLANISCDSTETRELMLTYGVGQVPAVVGLHKQIPVSRFVPENLDLGVDQQKLADWIESVAK